MNQEKSIAFDLQDFLVKTFTEVGSTLNINIEGNNAQWYVNVSKNKRNCRTQCYRENEYLICFYDKNNEIAEARTNNQKQIAACIKEWVVLEKTREDIYEQFSFVDKNRRALRSLAHTIDINQNNTTSNIRISIEEDWGGDIGCELWIYGEKRSCYVDPITDIKSTNCIFFIDRTQVASAQFKDDTSVAKAVYLWLNKSLTLTELAKELPALNFSNFATKFESGDIAEWHWANVLLRAKEEQKTDEDGVLGYYLPILEKIAVHPQISKFFSFTTLNHFCFSRCSYYPFATEGMPILIPGPEGYIARCDEQELQGNADEIFQFLSQHLLAVTVPPFHGCIHDSLIEPINKMLKEQNSFIRVNCVQCQQWSDVIAVVGDRSCKLRFDEQHKIPYSIEFYCADKSIALGQFNEKSTMVAAIRKWLENHGLAINKIAQKLRMRD